jgi:Zn-finger nucleic acid-binding protein
MTRINFERVSGILIDRCRDHGIWFDATELDGVLRWIKLGGERASDEQKKEEDRARASQLKLKILPESMDGDHSLEFAHSAQGDTGLDSIPAIVNWLLNK